MFEIKFKKSAYRQLNSIKRYDRNKILDKINEQLLNDPQKETLNKKPLRKNLLADWELRVDSYRVFYDVDDVEKKVRILAIGIKLHNQVFINGTEIKL